MFINFLALIALNHNFQSIRLIISYPIYDIHLTHNYSHNYLN
jgi:hypothetical protein